MKPTDYNEAKAKQNWRLFQKGHIPEAMDKRLLRSWQRSKSYGVDPYKIDTFVLSKEQLRSRIDQRKTFYDTAVPFLQSILDCIGEEDYFVTLYDEEGYALKILGNNPISKIENKKDFFVDGCNRSERFGGTFGIELAAEARRPAIVIGYESYHTRNHNRFQICAPIFDENRVAGCIALSGSVNNIVTFLEPLVDFASKAITRQLSLQEYISKLSVTKNNLAIILKHYDDAVLLIDEQGYILQINQSVETLFKKTEEKIVGKQINLFINPAFFDPFTDKEPIYAKEILNEIKGKPQRLIMSADPASVGGKKGFVMVLNEIKTMHKLANRIVGSHVLFDFNDIIGQSSSMRSTIKKAQNIAQFDAPVLILGETGTGKELFAQSIHMASPRNLQPFVAINCAALPRELVESELFGYEDGAFTGAKKGGNPGKFEIANGGTLFLDEIGDMPLNVQATLLRAIQNREITRIGGVKSIPVDVRIIAATNKDLLHSMHQKIFREDLYYRVSTFHISIPPLRKRVDDIEPLIAFFLEKYKNNERKNIRGFSSEATVHLLRYDWPGNVRELENVIEQCVYLASPTAEWIQAQDLPDNIKNASQKEATKGVSAETAEEIAKDTAREAVSDSLLSKKAKCNLSGKTDSLAETSLKLEALERETILQALFATGGNVTEAAKCTGISRRTLYRKMKKYNLKMQKRIDE